MDNPNIMVSVSGHAKSGKSHFGFTFPEPIMVFSFDLGADIVKRKFKGKDIQVNEYPMPLLDSVKAVKQQAEVKALFDQFNDDFLKACEMPDLYNTIMIDTWSACYQIARIARAKELGQQNLLQYQYGDVYAKLRSFIHRVQLSGQNLVLTTYLKPVYVDDKDTGEYTMDGWAGTASEVDVPLLIRADTRTEKGQKKTTNILTIQPNRFDRDLVGQEFVDATYDDLMTLILGGE